MLHQPKTAWMTHWEQLLRKLHLVPVLSDKPTLLQYLLLPQEGVRVLAFVNAHAMNMAASQAEFADHLSQADVLLRDGSGMQILLRLLRQPAGLNMNGTDFIPELLAACGPGTKVALWGTEEPFLARAKAKVTGQWGLDCVSCLDGFLPDEAYVAALQATAPQVVILGMGMPKQERVAALVKQARASDALVVCGGAILDFLGGKVSRAPKFFRQTGMEWFYRLVVEPRRLYRRYVLGNPVFLARAGIYRFLIGDEIVHKHQG